MPGSDRVKHDHLLMQHHICFIAQGENDHFQGLGDYFVDAGDGVVDIAHIDVQIFFIVFRFKDPFLASIGIYLFV